MYAREQQRNHTPIHALSPCLSHTHVRRHTTRLRTWTIPSSGSLSPLDSHTQNEDYSASYVLQLQQEGHHHQNNING